MGAGQHTNSLLHLTCVALMYTHGKLGHFGTLEIEQQEFVTSDLMCVPKVGDFSSGSIIRRGRYA